MISMVANPNQLTLPEVLAQLDALRDHCRSMVDEADPEDIWSCDVEALDAAIAALRGPTREQVARMKKEALTDKWDEWYGPVSKCPECGEENMCRINFCNWCGCPFTDEAVEILFKRLEGSLEPPRKEMHNEA